MIDPAFQRYAPIVLAREGNGAFTDRAADAGGPTRWGIDAATLGSWRQLGRSATAEEVQNLGEPEATEILQDRYWLEPGFDHVALVSERVADALLDAGVNLGPSWPSHWLQEVLNLCNRQGRDFADLVVDGHVGPATCRALAALIALRGKQAAEDLILACLAGEQYARYKAITVAGGPNGPNEQNFCGWISQRLGLP